MANKKQQETQETSPTQESAQNEAFAKHLDEASDMVRKWPEWKQQVLGGAAGDHIPNPKQTTLAR